jgi:HEAT repeat protein
MRASLRRDILGRMCEATRDRGRAASRGAARRRARRGFAGTGRSAGLALAIATVVGCSSAPAPPPRWPASARLPAPAPVDPGQLGAGYLSAVAAQLQPRWAAFLEDCRLRLPRTDPLNAERLVATYALAISGPGEIVARSLLASSGNAEFDAAAADVLADASPLPAALTELTSDDDLVHLRWQFARDRRQAGPATARVVSIELPLLAAVDRWLGRGELARASRRIAAAPAGEPARAPATARVMIAALREALASPDGAARRVAVEACGRAGVRELAAAVRAQLATAGDPELREAAVVAAGALGDRDAAPALVASLRDDLAQRSPIALTRIAALATLGQAEAAAGLIRAALDAGPNPVALTALAITPVPALVDQLARWSRGGAPAIRGAVCAAMPGAAPARAAGMISHGLRDPDATVRAACADAAARLGRAAAGRAMLQALRARARDRDRSVRARAIAAIAVLDPVHPAGGVRDRAPEVRAAAAAVATEAELQILVVDPDPDVRAAAWTALGGRARGVAVRAVDDPSPVVRRSAIAAIADPGVLARLARDDSPEVATAALVRLTALVGRSAQIAPLLEQLLAAPPASAERARIALAWLLAS